MAPAVIRFQSIEEWEANQEKVNAILEEDTGTSEYPATKSLPPIIVGVDLNPGTVEKLKQLDGVLVQLQDEDD